MTMMKNREKVVIVDALKNKYTLPLLLRKLNFPKSSYYYQMKIMKKLDKYFQYRELIMLSFHNNRNCYAIDVYMDS